MKYENTYGIKALSLECDVMVFADILNSPILAPFNNDKNVILLAFSNFCSVIRLKAKVIFVLSLLKVDKTVC